MMHHVCSGDIITQPLLETACAGKTCGILTTVTKCMMLRCFLLQAVLSRHRCVSQRGDQRLPSSRAYKGCAVHACRQSSTIKPQRHCWSQTQ